MSIVHAIVFLVGLALGGLCGIIAALYVLPPHAPSLLLGFALGVIVTIIGVQATNLARIARGERDE